MMFKVKCTGKNLNYGKKGEVRLLVDCHIVPAVKNGWIEKKVQFCGTGGTNIQVIATKNICKNCGQKINNELFVRSDKK